MWHSLRKWFHCHLIQSAALRLPGSRVHCRSPGRNRNTPRSPGRRLAENEVHGRIITPSRLLSQAKSPQGDPSWKVFIPVEVFGWKGFNGMLTGLSSIPKKECGGLQRKMSRRPCVIRTAMDSTKWHISGTYPKMPNKAPGLDYSWTWW